MFGIAGAVNVSSSGGGGGGDIEGGLLAEWRAPSTTYDASGNWEAYNDDSLVWQQGTSGYRPTRSGEKLVFDGTNDKLIGNAAIRSLFDGINDYSIVVVADLSAAGAYNQNYMVRVDSSTSNRIFFYTTIGATTATATSYFTDFRGGSAGAADTGNSSIPAGPALFVGSSEQGVNVRMRRSDHAAIDETVTDAAKAAPSAIYLGGAASFGYLTGNIHCVRIYDKALSDDDYAALQDFFSDNADYDLTGVTL